MRETTLFVSTALILTSGAALGQEKATPEQVVQKVQQAASYLSKKGEAGLTTFKERRSDYVWANTYVFVIDCQQKKVAANPDYSRRRSAYQEGGGCSASPWADVGFGCRSQSKPSGALTHHGKGYACSAQPVTGW
jgi:hypothetical protein